MFTHNKGTKLGDFELSGRKGSMHKIEHIEFGNLSHLYAPAKANEKQNYHNDDAPKPYWPKHSCGLPIGLILLTKSHTHIASLFKNRSYKEYDKDGWKHE